MIFLKKQNRRFEMGERITPDKGKNDNLFFVESDEDECVYHSFLEDRGEEDTLLDLIVRERKKGEEDDLVFDIWDRDYHERAGEIDCDFPRNLFHKLKGYDAIILVDIGLMMPDTVSYLLDYLSKTKTMVLCVVGNKPNVNIVTAFYVRWKCQEL